MPLARSGANQRLKERPLLPIDIELSQVFRGSCRSVPRRAGRARPGGGSTQLTSRPTSAAAGRRRADIPRTDEQNRPFDGAPPATTSVTILTGSGALPRVGGNPRRQLPPPLWLGTKSRRRRHSRPRQACAPFERRGETGPLRSAFRRCGHEDPPSGEWGAAGIGGESAAAHSLHKSQRTTASRAST
jgi:hypothetical protein